MVYRYDRFARSLRQLVNALEEFRGLGIEFVSLHEGVDTSTPNGRLVFGIFASIAEFERELIRDRVRSGLASARAKGKRLGRPTVTVDTARITALRASGRTWTSIGQELGVGEGTVRRAAAAKNLLQIALASALVPVLEPGHFDPPQIFVSGGAHFAEQGRYSAQTPDRAIRLPGPVPSAFSGF